MAVNPRFEISCNNPDGVQFVAGYSTSERNHFSSGPNIERNANFRENYESRSVAQGGGNSCFSGASGSGHGDLAPLSQVLSLDPVSLGEQKYARQLELRKATNAALGSSVDDSLPGNVQTRPLELLGSEELRRVKASIYDNLLRARERSRLMADAIAKLDRYRSINFRKRARTEPSIHEKHIASISVERSATIGSSVKICSSPSHANASDTTLKAEDKNKGAVPNKRVRSSMADVRLDGRQNGASMQRSSGLIDRDREFLRSNSSYGNQIEERDQLVSEGWEKTKMKGRRSGMKLDASTVTTVNGSLEVERDFKWGTQPRLNVESRSRPSEGHGFRSGPVHGVGLTQKVETAVQQNSLATRMMNKNESDSSSPVGEKADRFSGLDKERLFSKNTIKSLHREESNLSNSALVAKAKATRAPRSGAVNPPIQAIRSTSLGDVWDRLPPNKVQVPVGPTNRKRLAPTRSSSPPVTQWGGQRQKIARVRRMNFAPPVGPIPNKDEVINSGEGIISRDGNAMVGRSNSNMSAGSGFVGKVTSTTSLSQSKQKNERITPTGLSESDESEGGDVKSKEKGKKILDSEAKFAASSQKMGSLLFQAKTSPAVSKEEGGDGIRRQGRSGRALVAPMRGNATIASNEKVVASETQKQLRSARPGLEKMKKSDMKPGRPPSKKGAAERKASAKPRHPAGTCATVLSGESDDDYEDLVAAAHAAVNASASACSGNFWKQMEPYFAYLTRDDYEYLEQQVGGLEETDVYLSAFTRSERSELIDAGICNATENPITNIARKVGCLANGNIEADGSIITKIFNNLSDKESGANVKKGINGDWLERMIPLSQRLLAALIVEDDIDEANAEDPSFDDTSDTGRDESLLIDDEQEKDERNNVDLEIEDKRCTRICKPSSDDFTSSNGHRCYDEVGAESRFLAHPFERTLYNSMDSSRLEFDEKSTCLGLKMKENQVSSYHSGSWDIQYQQMNFDDRIFLELQSIGLSPELMPDVLPRDSDDIGEELRRMQLELKDRVSANKGRVQALEAVITTNREAEERDREHLAMMKLVEIAYARRTGWRPGMSGSKASSSKGARAAALAFAKRVLARWKNYVTTEKSCFTESGLRNILSHVSFKDSTSRAAANDSEAGEVCTMIAAVGPSLLRINDPKLPVATEGLGRLLGKEKTEKELSDSGHNTASEQTGGKEDILSSRTRSEALLEDMAGNGAVVESAVLGGTKGKRSERDRDGKGQIRDSLVMNDGSKGGRPGIGGIKGERKAKTKPRQNTAPLLKAVNGLIGKSADLPKEGNSTAEVTFGKAVDKLMKGKCESLPTDHVDVQVSPSDDLSHLHLPGIEDLVATDDLSGQGQDLGSWLDFEDPGLQDAPGDFVGLDVPMDDLSDLAMMM